MKQRVFLLFAVLCVVLAAAPRAGATDTTQAQPMRLIVKGSDTILPLNEEWARAFRRVRAGVTLEVQGGGSGVGITDLIAGKADIAATSRPLKASEIEAFEARVGRRPSCMAVALDGLAIFVHERNPVTVLSMEQVRDLFTGKTKKWRAVGGWHSGDVVVYTRDENSGTRAFLSEHALGGASFAASSRVLPTTRGIEDAVSTEPFAIGYGGVAYSPGTRIVRIATKDYPAGVGPSQENVVRGRYPLSRQLIYCFDMAAANPLVADFVRFALSRDGQTIVEKVGYYPLLGLGDDAEDVVRLTPASMAQHQFEVSVRRSAVAESEAEAWLLGQVKVQVAFDAFPAGTARVGTPVLLLGDRAGVPLRVPRQHANGFPRTVEFFLAPSVLAEAAVRVEVEAPDQQRRKFDVAVESFLR